MGYRSDVAIGVGGDNPAVFEQFLVHLKMWHIAEFGTSLKKGVFDGWGEDNYAFDRTSFMFCARDVKWYDSYPDVQRIEKLWDFIVEYFDGMGDIDNEDSPYRKLNARFIRIGEEYQDIEERNAGWGVNNVLTLRREIDFYEPEDELPWGDIHPLLSGTEFQSTKEEV